MGIYSEYLDQGTALNLDSERKKQLRRISHLRGREILVYASDSSKGRFGAAAAIDNSDLLPITDQISNLNGASIDVLLVTAGGSGETAEDIIRLLYHKYQSVAFIVPGMAKSAGTIMVMAGDEILMEPSSSLGPIDAQIQWEGKVFSAEAFLKGLDAIKEEASKNNSLNRAYIPILQRISPGEIQNADNALSFAKALVTEWLKSHKFKSWSTHRTRDPGAPVTPEQKEARAKEIAEALCDHSRWLSHGRSIKMEDLQKIGLEIRDYTQELDLADAIRRYHVLIQMTFDQTPTYKLFETTNSQVLRLLAQAPLMTQGPQLLGGATPRIIMPTAGAAGMMIPFACPKCQKIHILQADFDNQRPLQPNAEKFPSDDILVCNQCKSNHNLGALRKQLESQTGRKIAK